MTKTVILATSFLEISISELRNICSKTDFRRKNGLFAIKSQIETYFITFKKHMAGNTFLRH